MKLSLTKIYVMAAGWMGYETMQLIDSLMLTVAQ